MRIALRSPAARRSIGALTHVASRHAAVRAGREDVPLVPESTRTSPGEVIHAQAPAG